MSSAPDRSIPGGPAVDAAFLRRFVAFAFLAGGVGALWFGFTPDWDLLNYHLYNPHALLTGRGAIDVAPAQQQTFLNPALHLPVYLLFRYAGPEAMVFVIGGLQAAQAGLLLLLADELTDGRCKRWPYLVIVAALGLAGPIFLNQLGGSQGDTLLSALVLGGLLAVVRESRRGDDRATFKTGLLAGALLGIAIGLKLTFAIYAVGLGAASFLLVGGARRWKLTAGLAAGGVFGILLAGGPWFLHQWRVYGNPFMPYFNEFFRSPWVAPISYRDLRFMPAGVLEWLFYPFVWFTESRSVWEYPFRDQRMVLAIVALFLLPLFAWRRMRQASPALALTWLFLAISYLLWLRMFGIYRYISVLEMMAPLVLFATAALLSSARTTLRVMLAALVLVQFAIRYYRPDPTPEFRYDTPTALAGLPADAMVVVGGYEPLAYSALWLDDGIPMVRIRANFMGAPMPVHDMQQLAERRVRAHTGPHYLLQPGNEIGAPFLAGDLERVGLALPDTERCRPLFESDTLQRRLDVRLCPLERTGTP